MKDFKKMPKMANGGSVGKYNDGGKIDKSTIEYWADKRSPESKAAAEQRMTEYKEGKAKSMAQFKENMDNTSKAHDAKMKEIFNPPKSGGGSGGGSAAGEMPGKGVGGMKTNKPLYKRGGRVKRGNKKK
jgi:hypothetical protein